MTVIGIGCKRLKRDIYREKEIERESGSETYEIKTTIKTKVAKKRRKEEDGYKTKMNNRRRKTIG